MSLVSVKNLHVVFRKNDAPIIRGITFELDEHERLAIIGESGSGKSMTALSLLSLLPSTMKASGVVEVAGVDMMHADERTRNAIRGKTLAIVYQEPLTALDPLMRVGKQIAEPVRLHQHLKGNDLTEEVLSLLQKVRLDDGERIARAFPHELSGGQRQRVAIAMALACKPRILIADEPTTALDVTIQKGILELLDSLVESEKMSLLFITHDISIAKQISQRMIIMQHGVIVEQGQTQSVVNNPQHAYTRQLFEAARECAAIPFETKERLYG
ncbi:MAG: ABC transporter ATP-binding protein [Treponema sp.]|nr:ABC transporter ATP-binding protein [Treponema sp.]